MHRRARPRCSVSVRFVAQCRRYADCTTRSRNRSRGWLWVQISKWRSGRTGLFVRDKELQTTIRSPIWGWMGHAAPFDFATGYQAAGGIRSFLVGTPAVLGLAALDQALDITLDRNIDAVRAKSLALTELFMELVVQECGGFGLEIVTPRGNDRGSQVSLSHREGYPIVQALISRGVIGDFRSPDILRFGFAPLYISYVDVWDAVSHLKEVMTSARRRRCRPTGSRFDASNSGAHWYDIPRLEKLPHLEMTTNIVGGTLYDASCNAGDAASRNAVINSFSRRLVSSTWRALTWPKPRICSGNAASSTANW